MVYRASFFMNKVWHFPNGSSITFEDKDMEGLGNMAGLSTREYDSPMQRLSVRKEVELEIVQLEKQLAQKREMLELLSRNPDIERFMDLSRGTV